MVIWEALQTLALARRQAAHCHCRCHCHARCGIALTCFTGLRVQRVDDIAHIAAAIAGDARLEAIGHSRRSASIRMAARMTSRAQRRGDFLRGILPVVFAVERDDGVLLPLIAPQRVRQLIERVRILRAVNGHHRQMLVALLLSGAQRAEALSPCALSGAAERVDDWRSVPGAILAAVKSLSLQRMGDITSYALGEESLDFEVNALPARCQAGGDIKRA